VLLQDVQHLPAVLCLGHNFKILFQCEQAAEAIPKNRMVVGHNDSNLGLGSRG